MIEDVKRYPGYKDAGMESLAEVPRRWEVRRIKRICRLAYGDALASASRNVGTVSVLGSNGPVGLHDLANTHAPCIVVGRKGSFGKVNYSVDSVFAIDTTFFVDDRHSSAHLRWLYYLLGWLQLDQVTRDSAIPGLDRQDVYQKRAVVPPLPEQRAIARFLDHADRRIRCYIRAKEQLIALLEEQKQAIIHQAVTGQIDVRTGQPYPAYKSSGLEWSPEVPEDWEVWRLKQATRILRGKFTHRPRNDPTLYDGPYPFVQTGDVARAGKNVRTYSQTLNEAGRAVSRVFPAGTLVMAIAANIGDVAVLDFDACFPDSVVGFVPQTSVQRDFLYYLFVVMKRELIRDAPVNTQGNLNVDRLGFQQIPLPTLPEQECVIQHIDATTGDLDIAVGRIRRQIRLLREFRTRLIADVVTGKLDVREAAAALPDIDPLAAGDTLNDPAEPIAEPEPALPQSHP